MPQQVQDLKRAKQLVKELLSLTDEAIHQCQGARSWGFLDILGGSTLSTLVKHVKISSTKNVLDDINYKIRELKQCININNMPEGFTVNRGFFATLLDFTWDGFISDLWMQSKIKGSLNELQELKSNLLSLDAQLNR